MVYKGEDLDLRIPHGGGRGAAASPSNAWLSRALEQADESQPIWVDDTVLALCNQAFDLAVILGAAEVGLEHLVHAMTQIEDTSDVLYAHNIHVSTLRRESTAIILEEVPAGKADGKSSPLKSAEFEEVLQHAADQAYARRSPVTTEDILEALFDMSRENASRKLLSRHRTDFNIRDMGSAAPRPDEGRQKVRVSAGSHHVGETPRSSTVPPSVTDTLQNTRIDALERAIRELTDDIALNRKTFGTLLDEIRGTNGSQPISYPQPLPPNGVDDPNVEDTHEILYLMGRLERSMDTKFTELARTWTVLGDRLTSLENLVDDLDGRPLGDGGTVSDERLDRLENLLTSLPQRLSEMERRIQHHASSQARPIDTDRMVAKLDAIEKLIADSPAGHFELGPVMSGLRDIENSLQHLGGQVREIDTRTGDLNLVAEGIGDRQQRLENQFERQEERFHELTTGVREEIAQIGNALLGQTDGGERIQALVENSLRGVSDTFERQKDAISASVTSAVAERFAGLASLMQNRQSETSDKLAGIQERMGDLEMQIRTLADRPVTVNGAAVADDGFIGEAVSKIISNQHTLATSIDDWRGEARTDIAAIRSRLDTLEQQPTITPPSLPTDKIDEISQRMERIQSTLTERQDGWSRFKIWLYGTNDWYGASWGGADEEDRGWGIPQRRVEMPEREERVEETYENRGQPQRDYETYRA